MDYATCKTLFLFTVEAAVGPQSSFFVSSVSEDKLFS
ncbi:hypothetical protein MUK42_01822 [Musa troglodytarum]|uniref:Uncharacterized protein n=1 Tax=Musa troglodytarum TaxID=320322 RepID=A0A9E7FBQ6_9LILI|nr:hypothetical protein MUK42_01822 [Musa troglodytarum]